MKRLFGLVGAALLLAFLARFMIKIQEVAVIVVMPTGVMVMLVDFWQPHDEPHSGSE